ncbi:type IV pilus assembly protein PilM [Candidatus Saccharibacteria bacterium]|nr:type IV pilus assembly protein PilM [Candidatus Saccharibacteria bacterium]
MSLGYGVGDFFSLDIGTDALRMVQLAGNAQHGWSLQRFAYVPVSRSILQDSSDTGKRRLGETIASAAEQAGIKTKNIALGLPSNKTFTTVIEVPTQDRKSMEKVVRYHEDQYIPMPIEDAKVDYAILGPSPNDPNLTEVLLSCTSINYAEERMEGVENFGFNLVAQEPDPIAMSRALTPPGLNDARLIIDYGEDATDLSVVYGAPRLVRMLPGGLSMLVRTVANSLNVKESQARQFILKFGLAQDKLDGQVFKALDQTLENFASELSKSIRFFQNKYPNVKVGGVVLSGFAGIIPFMAEYIEAKTGIPTVQGNPWQMVQVTPQQQQALSQVAAEFAVAIGLAERTNSR